MAFRMSRVEARCLDSDDGWRGHRLKLQHTASPWTTADILHVAQKHGEVAPSQLVLFGSQVQTGN